MMLDGLPKVMIDQRDDLNGAKDYYAPGTIAYTAGLRHVWQLSYDKEWIEVSGEGIEIVDEDANEKDWGLKIVIPDHPDELTEANNDQIQSITINSGTVTITVDVDALTAFESSNPAQGTHKWLGIGIGTDVRDITKLKYQGTNLEEADAEEATSVGLDPGFFILYLRADEIGATPKVVNLSADYYEPLTLTITVAEPEGGND